MASSMLLLAVASIGGVQAAVFRGAQGQQPIAATLANEGALYQELEAMGAKNGMIIEGHSNQVMEEMTAMNNLVSDPKVQTVCETGFNGGHGTLRWLLHSSPTTKVYSFDIGQHSYSKPAADWFSQLFPGRHTITWGDSTKTIPAFKAANPNVKCNLIFVDGGHDYNVAAADLINFWGMADPNYNVLLMDDVFCSSVFCQGPNAAWTNLISSGAAAQISAVPTVGGTRGFAYGAYKIVAPTQPPMLPAMLPTAFPTADPR